MKILFEIADEYIHTSDWKTISVLKFCLLSLGFLFGLQIREDGKKQARIIAFSIFAVTYIPLIAKLFRITKKYLEQSENSTNSE